MNWDRFKHCAPQEISGKNPEQWWVVKSEQVKSLKATLKLLGVIGEPVDYTERFAHRWYLGNWVVLCRDKKYGVYLYSPKAIGKGLKEKRNDNT